MKRISTFLLALLLLSYGKEFSQADSCKILGCAADYGVQTTNNALADLPNGYPGTCYAPFNYKQVFWQFFFSPTASTYTQTFTPGASAVPLDIDWVAYDIGSTAPTISCPVDHSTWTEVACNIAGNNGDPAGPGTDGILATTAGEYYAIGIIINSDGADPSPGTDFTFTVGAPLLGVT
ncbi:MAG TPA: hypothetical protein VGI82_06275, partial [Chitinophagaceae bacterium]